MDSTWYSVNYKEVEMTSEERYMLLIKNYNKKLNENKKKGIGDGAGWTPFVDGEALLETSQEIKRRKG